MPGNRGVIQTKMYSQVDRSGDRVPVSLDEKTSNEWVDGSSLLEK